MFGSNDSQARGDVLILQFDIKQIQDNYNYLIERYCSLLENFNLLMEYLNVELVDHYDGPRFSIKKKK